MSLHRAIRITSKDLWRGVALFLLTFVISDLAILDVLFPDHCSEILVGCHTEPPHPSQLQTPTDSISTPSDPPALQIEAPRPVQKDFAGDDCGTCLSCCAHVLAAAEYHWVSVKLPSARYAPVSSWLPTTLSKPPFHPPRFC